MADTKKQMSDMDANSSIRASFNDVDNSLTTGSFLTGLVGRKVVRQDTDSEDLDGAASGDDFSYLEDQGNTLLYTIRVLYSDLDKNDLISAERVE